MRHTTAEDRERMIAMRRRGLGVAEVAARTGFSRRTVIRHTEPQWSRLCGEKAAKAVAYWDRGKTCSEIGRILDVPRDTIRRHIRSTGRDTNRKAIREKNVRKARELAAAGWRHWEIASVLGLTKKRIDHYCSAKGGAEESENE